jgi:diphthamide biosynthesis enzyme Dph1/Dph2-like protein
MKQLFIPAKSKAKLNSKKISEISRKLPKNIAIAYSIQFKEIANETKKILSKNNKITKLIQVLGCSKPKFPKSTQAILLIGNGKFHAISLAFESKLPTYLLDHTKFEKISEKDIQNLEKKRKGSYLNFLNQEKVGILVSTKPGQNRLKKALELKKKLGKKSYLFISNNINTSEFENFRLKSWINTACPRMDMNNNRIVNISEIN